MPRTKSVSDEAILDGALRALVALGPGRFTLAAAAAESHLAAPTLIQRFGSKRRLMVAALRHGNRLLGREIDGTAARADAEGLVRFLADLARGFGDRATMADNLALLSEDLRDPELAVIAAERSALLRRAAERWLPRMAIPRRRAARLVEAQWHGSVIQAALSGEDDIAKAVERSLRALLALMRRPGG